ncbi:hypothetical protein HDV00_001826 [Rhizophlyctis rosea]|nr:hypothetical protein HDV00_001826 [Rhizophlyctis rosea]
MGVSISGLSASMASSASAASKRGAIAKWFRALRNRIHHGPILEKKVSSSSGKGQDPHFLTPTPKWTIPRDDSRHVNAIGPSITTDHISHHPTSIMIVSTTTPSITSTKTYPTKSIDARSQGRESIHSGYSSDPPASPQSLPSHPPDPSSSPAVNFCLPHTQDHDSQLYPPPPRTGSTTAIPHNAHTTTHTTHTSTSLNRPESTKSSVISASSTKAASTTALFSGHAGSNPGFVVGTGPRSDAGTLTSTRAVHAPSIMSGRSGRGGGGVGGHWHGGDHVSIVTAWSFGERSMETGRERGGETWSVRDRETESIHS